MINRNVGYGQFDEFLKEGRKERNEWSDTIGRNQYSPAPQLINQLIILTNKEYFRVFFFLNYCLFTSSLKFELKYKIDRQKKKFKTKSFKMFTKI